MKLCVALDLASKEQCLRLAKELEGLDVWLKIGLRSYVRDGFALIEGLKKINPAPIFLDLKFYDIPNTMADACEECLRLGVDMINLHASAGGSAMDAVMKRLNRHKKRPLVLGVSALTSFDGAEFFEIYGQKLDGAVVKLAKLAHEKGLDGVVCSVFESLLIKENTQNSFLTLTPGIRPFGEASGDQKRVANLQEAKKQKSDFIVVGRPIYEADEPRKICEKILAQL
ncbi:orotidine-5'-phosphate decarboxylase [Campylobacter sp.]|uniref:orotidine-5'-phosphate decarboxylase n=1 Tax=Campylobacter sp. TaxID=205 RepID=UPI0034C5FB6D